MIRMHKKFLNYLRIHHSKIRKFLKKSFSESEIFETMNRTIDLMTSWEGHIQPHCCQYLHVRTLYTCAHLCTLLYNRQGPLSGPAGPDKKNPEKNFWPKLISNKTHHTKMIHDFQEKFQWKFYYYPKILRKALISNPT